MVIASLPKNTILSPGIPLTLRIPCVINPETVYLTAYVAKELLCTGANSIPNILSKKNENKSTIIETILYKNNI